MVPAADMVAGLVRTAASADLGGVRIDSDDPRPFERRPASRTRFQAPRGAYPEALRHVVQWVLAAPLTKSAGRTLLPRAAGSKWRLRFRVNTIVWTCRAIASVSCGTTRIEDTLARITPNETSRFLRSSRR